MTSYEAQIVWYFNKERSAEETALRTWKKKPQNYTYQKLSFLFGDYINGCNKRL